MDYKKGTVHFSGLNGLRAIASLSVVTYHTALAVPSFGLNPLVLKTAKDGHPICFFFFAGAYSVTIFFALSGFLITYLLLREKENSDVDVKKFYIRRILRIWPLYYTYFAICIAVDYFYRIEIQKSLLLYYIFLAANIPLIFRLRQPINHGNFTVPLVGHYWSLGVEEQFYLCWPWAVKKIKNTLLMYLIPAIIIGFIALSFIFRFFTAEKEYSVPYLTLYVTRMHCMLIGAYGALLYYNNNSIFLKIFSNKITQLAAWIILLLYAANFYVSSFIDNEIISVVTVALIIGQITIKNRLINLEKKVFDHLGKISYGIYVIHPLIIFFLGGLFKNIRMAEIPEYILIYLIVMTLTIFTASVSYKYFENRFLRLKNKYSVIRTSDTKTVNN